MLRFLISIRRENVKLVQVQSRAYETVCPREVEILVRGGFARYSIVCLKHCQVMWVSDLPCATSEAALGPVGSCDREADVGAGSWIPVLLYEL